MTKIRMSWRISAIPRATGTPRYINRRHLSGQLLRRRLQFAAAPNANFGVESRGPKIRMLRPYSALMRIDCSVPTRVCNAICKKKECLQLQNGWPPQPRANELDNRLDGRAS